MVGGRVGFLVAGLWEGVRGIFEKVIFRPAFFCACCHSMSLHIFAATLAFFVFFRVLGGLAHHNRCCMLLGSARKCGFIWEFTSGAVSAFSAYWLDSGYMYDVSLRVRTVQTVQRPAWTRVLTRPVSASLSGHSSLRRWGSCRARR